MYTYTHTYIHHNFPELSSTFSFTLFFPFFSPKCVSCTRRFGTCLYTRLHVTGCHDTDTYSFYASCIALQFSYRPGLPLVVPHTPPWFPDHCTTYGRTPWTSDQLVARLLPTKDSTMQREKGKTTMPYAGLDSAIQCTRAQGLRFRPHGHWIGSYYLWLFLGHPGGLAVIAVVTPIFRLPRWSSG
jgi:hypothetical protein